MEFKDKLQVLRCAAKLSQEDLAQACHISRQAITKWENGQAFPEIDHLIFLSQLFHVSIDYLVKKEELCQIKELPVLPHEEENLRAFLIEARLHTYAVGQNLDTTAPHGVHRYLYETGPYAYCDCYVGDSCFSGEETLQVEGEYLWSMNYYGQVLDASFSSAFLKEALIQTTVERPYRGPSLYQTQDQIYQSTVVGDFTCFHGEETIYVHQAPVYHCFFHGGMLQ